MDRPIVFLDTETATLHGPPHVIELGAVRVEDGEVVDQFESLVQPQIEIDPEASAFHGIGYDDVRSAPPPAEVLERFHEWVQDDWMAAHNAEMDARNLGFEYARAELEPPTGLFLDSLRIARRAIPEAENHRLDTLCEWLGLEDGTRHRALADAVWCWKVLEACAQRLGSEDGETAGSAALLAASGRPCTIASESPALRRGLRPRLRPLERACSSREEVRLLYGEPPATPVPLRVVPLLLFRQGQKNYMEAECRQTGTLKTYRLDRIHKILT